MIEFNTTFDIDRCATVGKRSIIVAVDARGQYQSKVLNFEGPGKVTFNLLYQDQIDGMFQDKIPKLINFGREAVRVPRKYV